MKRSDPYGLESQRRVAAAREAGRFADEIVPIKATMAVIDKETKEVSHREVEIAHDEGPRADTTAEGLAGLKPVREGGTNHRRQCEPAFGRRICPCDDEREGGNATRAGAARHLPGFRGCRLRAPTRWASARSFAMPRLLERHGLKVDDIGPLGVERGLLPCR